MSTAPSSSVTPATGTVRSAPVTKSAAARPTIPIGTVPMAIARASAAESPGPPSHVAGRTAARVNPATSRR